MISRAEMKQKFIDALIATGKQTITKAEIKTIATKLGLKSTQFFTKDDSNKVGRGEYRVPQSGVNTMPALQAQVIPMTKQPEKSNHKISNVQTDLDTTNLIPTAYKNYVPFGNFDDVLSIVQSGQFFPVFITGHSGNGKTMSTEQACAKAKRKFVCVSMTPETDEGDLLGNYVLINGNMEWQDGPVILAMKRGAILLLDEVDLGTEKCMCLQPVLEGKGVYLKKIGQFVAPVNGFNVIATANTKGKGSDDGRFVGTRVMNEAALDRYDYTFEQEYAPRSTEKKILLKAMKKFNKLDEAFADCLVKWTEIIRKSFAEGAVDEIISTRRAINICKAYAMFGNKQKAITLSLTRFDKDTQTAFMSLYNKIDAETVAPPIANEKKEVAASDPDVPF